MPPLSFPSGHAQAFPQPTQPPSQKSNRTSAPRIIKACLTCKRRKVRCLPGGSNKPCAQCKQRKLECEYEDPNFTPTFRSMNPAEVQRPQSAAARRPSHVSPGPSFNHPPPPHNPYAENYDQQSFAYPPAGVVDPYGGIIPTEYGFSGMHGNEMGSSSYSHVHGYTHPQQSGVENLDGYGFAAGDLWDGFPDYGYNQTYPEGPPNQGQYRY
ncbi:hypothetical protein MKEN_01341100 [Mycena kentingensis (nom. inval.)]|nr:hypothetical protein MKEN_01341100 [Mycena kentingensis (nom. inval.)]